MATRVSPALASLVCGVMVACSTRDGSTAAASPDAASPRRVPECISRASLPLPDDPSVRGPWAVGARTVTLAGLVTEVWYPAHPGSDVGVAAARYDLRATLSDSDRAKIPDADAPFQDCDCRRDLPIDEAHGPYPVIVFLHGLAGFRTQSLSLMTHWASRGFIVVSADHPDFQLRDVLAGAVGRTADLAADAERALDAIAAGGLAFLQGRADAAHAAVVGHSAGGIALSVLGCRADVRVLVPLAAGGTFAAPGCGLESTLVMAAKDDGVMDYASTRLGYDRSPPSKRLVAFAKAGHLVFSDACATRLLAVAIDHGVAVPTDLTNLLRTECAEGEQSAEFRVVRYATSAALEETLVCNPRSAAALSDLARTSGDVAEYDEQLD